MLKFTRHFGGKTDQITVEPRTLIVAGWTGRDEAALNHHIEELAAIGVPRPSSVPVFYRNAVSNVVQTDRLEGLGPGTAGEGEPPGVAPHGRLLVRPWPGPTHPQAGTNGISPAQQTFGQGSRTAPLE